MKAIGYGRASTNGQEAKGYSLEDQQESIKRFCAQNGIELADLLIETESAATIKDRSIFKKALLQVYTTPEIDALIIMNLDRHSRTVFDYEIIKRGLAKRGKKLISVQEQFLTPVHAVDPEFEDYLESARQHRMVDAEQERKRTRRRCIRGKKAKEQRGGWIGFRPPFECDVVQGALVVNFERSTVLRHMRRLRNWLGWTYGKIANYMNGSNDLPNRSGDGRGRVFPPPHARDPLKKRNKPLKKGCGVWSACTVYNLVGNPRERDWDSRKGRVKAS